MDILISHDPHLPQYLFLLSRSHTHHQQFDAPKMKPLTSFRSLLKSSGLSREPQLRLQRVTCCYQQPISCLKMLMSTDPSASSSASLPSNLTISSNSDPEELKALLKPLLRENGGVWTITAKGNGLEREFKFKGFKKCWVRSVVFLSYRNVLLIVSPFSPDSLCLENTRLRPSWQEVQM
jgi:hypothetical protein